MINEYQSRVQEFVNEPNRKTDEFIDKLKKSIEYSRRKKTNKELYMQYSQKNLNENEANLSLQQKVNKKNDNKIQSYFQNSLMNKDFRLIEHKRNVNLTNENDHVNLYSEEME